MQTYIDAKIHIYTLTCTHTRHTHTHAYTHTHDTHTYMHTHTYTHTHKKWRDASDTHLHDFGAVVSDIREGIYPRGERVRHIHNLNQSGRIKGNGRKEVRKIYCTSL